MTASALQLDPLINARPISYLQKMENAILSELKAGINGSIKADRFPAAIQSYDFAGLDGAVLVHYMGSNFTPRNGPANPNQSRRMNFALVLLSRNLRDDGGAYQALEDIRLAVQGVAFEGAGPAEIVSDQLISEDQGQWRWQIVIGLNAPAVARDRQTPAPLMRPVTQEA